MYKTSSNDWLYETLVFFKVNDNELFKNSKKIWKKISNLMNIEFDSEPIYGDVDKYLKTKIKMYGDRVNTKFHGKKVHKENASYKFLSLIILDYVISIILKYL